MSIIMCKILRKTKIIYYINKISFHFKLFYKIHRNDLGLKTKICYKNHEYLIDS